jgi:hypothetical protein
MNPLLLTFGVLGLSLLYAPDGMILYSQISPLVVLAVFVAISFSLAALSFRWCFPKQSGMVVGTLAGMFCLSVILNNSELLAALLQHQMHQTLGGTVLTIGRVTFATLGLCLVFAFLSVLLLELPITWFCSWCWNRRISKDGCAEIRWLALLWFFAQGWSLFDDFLKSRYPAVLEALSGVS